MACKTIKKRRAGYVKMCEKNGRWLFAGSVTNEKGAKSKGRRKGKGPGRGKCAGLNKRTHKLKKGYSFVNMKAGSKCPKKVA